MYIPLCNKTHYSLQTGYSKIDDIVSKCAEYNIPSIAITDNTMSSAIKLYSKCKDIGIKPIYGLNIETVYKNSNIDLLMYAKNINGYKSLISISNKNQLNKLAEEDLLNCEDVIVVSKDRGDKILLDFNAAYKNDFYIGVTAVNRNITMYDMCREFANSNNIKPVALNETLYTNKEDRNNHLTLLCSAYKKTYSEIKGLSHMNKAISEDRFYLENSNSFNVNTEEELKNSIEISDKCDNFSILGKLSLPLFSNDSGSGSELLRDLCRNGWKNKISNKIDERNQSVYIDRIKYELDVIDRCGLSGYFLIVQDYVNWAKNNGMLVGFGRGSAAGSLISYLVNITEVDPIKYNLLFERFYNEGRNSPGSVAIPDIDVDFPPSRRHEVFSYIRNKYSDEKVCQVATFAALKGRGALKEILRIHEVCDEKTANEITKNLPQEGSISDKLEQDKEVSIIRWTLNNQPALLSDWCEYNNGTYSGSMAQFFKQAVEIEGTYKSYGKHASAIVISSDVISENYQILKDKSSDDLLLGIEYEDAEKSGLPKMDILGLELLDKLMNVKSLLRTGKLLDAKHD